MTDHDPRPHLDGVLKAITITMNEHIAGDITDQNAASTYLAAIASTLTNIGRTLADIRDALNRPTAGTCTAVYRTTIVAPHDTATYGCRHPHGHTGAHQDRNRTTTWLDTAHGAAHLDNPEPPAPTGICPAADQIHHTNETIIHGCILTYGHTEPHTSGTGHTWNDTPRTCGAYRDPDDWTEAATANHGPLTDWPCVLPAGHDGHHADRDDDTFPRT